MAAAVLGSSPPLFLIKWTNTEPLAKFCNSNSSPCLSLTLTFSSSSSSFPSIKRLGFQVSSALHGVASATVSESLEEKPDQIQQQNQQDKRKKLYVQNLPWTFSSTDLQGLFAQCGTVKDVEIIKHKNGKHRGFAFITMASAEEARAVIDKFDSFELEGRIIRIEFAKSLKKPSPPAPVVVNEQRTYIYVSNLAWKVRSNNLKEFFMAIGTPLSSRVVFQDSPSGKSAGYGFVAYATKEEAEAAISALDGKELMGRPLRLRLNERQLNKSGGKPEEANDEEVQSEESNDEEVQSVES